MHLFLGSEIPEGSSQQIDGDPSAGQSSYEYNKEKVKREFPYYQTTDGQNAISTAPPLDNLDYPAIHPAAGSHLPPSQLPAQPFSYYQFPGPMVQQQSLNASSSTQAASILAPQPSSFNQVSGPMVQQQSPNPSSTQMTSIPASQPSTSGASGTSETAQHQTQPSLGMSEMTEGVTHKATIGANSQPTRQLGVATVIEPERNQPTNAEKVAISTSSKLVTKASGLVEGASNTNAGLGNTTEGTDEPDLSTKNINKGQQDSDIRVPGMLLVII